MIQVVDVFAGPGGLGKGFSSHRDSQNKPRFSLAISMEKDPIAHQTLRLRALSRRLHDRRAYNQFIQGKASWADLKTAYRREIAEAEAEAQQLELGLDS